MAEENTGTGPTPAPKPEANNAFAGTPPAPKDATHAPSGEAPAAAAAQAAEAPATAAAGNTAPSGKATKEMDDRTRAALLHQDVRDQVTLDEKLAAELKAAAGNAEKAQAASNAHAAASAAIHAERLKSVAAADQAAYTAFSEANKDKFKEAMPKAEKFAKVIPVNVLSHVAEHSKKYAAGAALLTAAAALMPGKETQKEDGTTEKKRSGFMTAVVAIGGAATLALGIAVATGGEKSFVGKLAAERVAKAANVALNAGR